MMRALPLRCLLAGLLYTLALPGDVFAGSPRTFLVDPALLSRAREAYRGGKGDIVPVVQRLLKDADKALALTPRSVMDKEQVPPSGDRHDYMSMARYWWPDPEKPGGLPYIRRDGVVNPEINGITDHDEISRLIKGVGTLALGYFFSGKEAYAVQASRLLRVWFLDSSTRMNPNLNYAQAVPGRSEGRGAGIIDTHLFPDLIDAVGLLGDSPSWTPRDQQGLEAWFAAYLRWLQESVNGRAESAAKNNHGTWYDVQVCAAAFFVRDTALAAATVRGAQARRIASQIEPDGRQPEELRRTKSWDYSFFNLAALFRLASLAERVKIDLWRFQTSDGRSIRSALDWLLPYVAGERTWSHEQIVKKKSEGIAPLLLKAGEVWNETRYREAARTVEGFNARTDRALLFLERR